MGAPSSKESKQAHPGTPWQGHHGRELWAALPCREPPWPWGLQVSKVSSTCEILQFRAQAIEARSGCHWGHSPNRPSGEACGEGVFCRLPGGFCFSGGKIFSELFLTRQKGVTWSILVADSPWTRTQGRSCLTLKKEPKAAVPAAPGPPGCSLCILTAALWDLVSPRVS